MNIPDLRLESEHIELDHISVLLEGLVAALRASYPGDQDDFAFCAKIDPETMREDILRMFTRDAFFRLFGSEFGKGVLVGAFFQRFIIEGEEE